MDSPDFRVWEYISILFCVGSLNGWSGCASLNNARGQGEPETFGWNWREFLIRDHLVTTGDRRYRLIESTRLWRRFEGEWSFAFFYFERQATGVFGM